MKKMLLIALAMVFVASIASAASVVNSKHDMRTWITGETNTEVCVYCHTPHQSGTTQVPLWNHTLSTAGSYGQYTSPTLDGTISVAPASNDGTVTSLCMSCHDGTVAINSLFNPPNNGSVAGTGFTGNINATGNITGAANLGTGANALVNDHPVNLDYQSAITNGDTGLNTGATVTALLIGGQVTCASCHQVHDPQFPPFLRVDNTGSALCLVCHNR